MDSVPPPADPAPDRTAMHGPPPQLKLEFGGAGWVLLLAGLLGAYLLLKLTWPLLSGAVKPQPLGMPSAAERGFDLRNSRVPAEQIASAAPPDSIPPLVMPPTVPGAEAAALTKEYRRKYHHKFVVGGDRVIGVSINGESRAYQLKLLQWHEVANDVVGGVPIAVTYSPLTDSAVVYDRRVGGDARLFAASGLLYNSNSLLYDSAESHSHGSLGRSSAASLWSQLDGRAVAGPLADVRLTALPCELTHWSDWLARHPQSTLLSHDTGHNREYTKNAYGAYFDRQKLRFPVAPAPAGTPAEQFARWVAVQLPDGAWRSFSYEQLKAQPEQDGLRFVYEPYGAGLEPDSVRLAEPAGLPVVYGLRFALEAFGYAE